MFDHFGVTAGDLAVYRELFARSPATLDDLAAALGRPVADVAACLDRLIAAGFVSRADAPDERYAAVPPGLALRLAVSREDLALRDRLDALARLRASVPAVAADLTGGTSTVYDGESPITVVHDPAVVRDSIAEATSQARSSLRLIGPTRAPDLAGLRDDVAVHAIFERASLDDHDVAEAAGRAVIRGAHIRLLPRPPMSAVIADDDLAVIAIEPGHGYGAARGIVVHPSPMLTGLLSMFELLWDRAIPFGASTSDSEITWRISDDDATLLRLLAAGLKDQAIARHLGIGLRTVVRRIGNLSRALDAETRFQAGLQAARRGLL